MSRIGLVVAAASMLGAGLAGCSSMLASSSADQQLQPLNFESDPPGAEVRTIQGQTCITPCALTVPAQEQPVTISHAGYIPQTVQVTTGPQPDHSFWENPPPTLVPNPVRVVMQAAKPPKPVRRRPRRRRTSAKVTAAPSAAADPQAAPPAASSPSPFPPPPTQQQPAADSAFPPPPSSQ